MATINTYQPRVALTGAGRVPQIDPGAAAAPARALAGVGQALGQLGDAVDKATEQDEVLWATSEVAAARERWTREALDRQGKVAPGAPGYTGGLIADFDADLADRVKAAPSGRAARYLEARMADLRGGLYGSALTFEVGERQRNRAAVFGDQIDAASRTVGADPGQYDAVLRDLTGALTGLDLPPDQRQRLADRARDEVSFAAAVTAGLRDPAAALGAAGASGAPLPLPPAWQAPAATVMKIFTDAGYSPAAAAAVAGRFGQESGFDPNAVHDGGTGLGIGGWRDPQPGEGRKSALAAYAAERGLDPRSIETQARFALFEMQTGEKAIGDRLKAAATVEDAARIMMDYERPAGWTAADPTKGAGWGEGLGYALTLAGVDAAHAVRNPAALPGFDALPWDKQQQAIATFRAEASRRETAMREARSLYAAQATEFERMMKQGWQPSRADLATLRDQATAAGDAATLTKLATAEDLLAFQTVARTWSPAELQGFVNQARSGIGASGEVSPAAAQKLDLAEGLLNTMRSELKADPLSWAARVGLVRVPPLDAADPAALRTRVVAAETVAQKYGVPTRLLTADEARQIVAPVETAPPEGKAQALYGVLAGGARDFGEHWPRAFPQLEAAGLPPGSARVADALGRGDDAAARRLVRAITVKPGDLPGRPASSDKDIAETIQDEIMAEGQIGDAVYALGTSGDGAARAATDGDVLRAAVRLRLADGEDLTKAVRAAARDLYGPIHAVDNGDAGVIALPDQLDGYGRPDSRAQRAFDGRVTDGLELLRAEARKRAGAAVTPPDAANPGDADHLRRSSERWLDQLVEDGQWRNVGAGFGLVDPASGLVLSGPGGPIIFSVDEAVKASDAGLANTDAAIGGALPALVPAP
ncbi:phage tail tip lysozyme [Zavarzinia aquatilis]|uniref:Phage tail lysozyme domain-containing protein n=1 Tax=Zavarzinia aquatilis TaxID=2211142 RepID=A0A317EFC3_9PROT|nr:phage tail tip lysozyme [Zavarzinia aquatilis]PWR24986.1 hypothetical protein DKG74_04245 [Zavarzinia aquatilis]